MDRCEWWRWISQGRDVKDSSQDVKENVFRPFLGHTTLRCPPPSPLSPYSGEPPGIPPTCDGVSQLQTVKAMATEVQWCSCMNELKICPAAHKCSRLPSGVQYLTSTDRQVLHKARDSTLDCKI